jgi:hypothetical protein
MPPSLLNELSLVIIPYLLFSRPKSLRSYHEIRETPRDNYSSSTASDSHLNLCRVHGREITRSCDIELCISDTEADR